MRVVTALAAVGSGVLATVLSLLLTGTSATASTTTNPTGDSATQQDNQSTQNNQDQLQAPDQAPSQTYLGGGHGSSGGT